MVRDLFGAMAAEGVAGSFIATSGTYAGEDKEFAQGRHIQLVDEISLKNRITNFPTNLLLIYVCFIYRNPKRGFRHALSS